MPSGDWRAPMVLLSTRLTEVRAFRCAGGTLLLLLP